MFITFQWVHDTRLRKVLCLRVEFRLPANGVILVRTVPSFLLSVPCGEHSNVTSEISSEGRIKMFANIIPFVVREVTCWKLVCQIQKPLEEVDLFELVNEFLVEELTATQKVITASKLATHK